MMAKQKAKKGYVHKQSSPIDDKSSFANGNSRYLLILILFVTIVVFFPSLQGSFTNWDDPEYVLDNEAIKGLSISNIKIVFTSVFQGNYQPIAMMTYMIEHSLFELDPFIYHLTNLIFHLLNTWLVFYLIRLLTKNTVISFITAILFGINALQVESVAWISERKNVVYAFFYLAALINYILYVTTKNKFQRKYLFYSLGLFVLSLLSKGQAVTLPITFFAVDFLLKRKFNRKLILEKVPFLILSIIIGITAINVQNTFGVIKDEGLDHSFIERFLFASYSIITYVYKLIAPVHLSNFYPYPEKIDGAYPIIFYIAPLLVLIICFAIFRTIKKTQNYAFGALFFLINIFLVLQLLPVGIAVMADRYAYLPCIGVFYMVGYGFFQLQEHKKSLFKKYKTVVLVIFAGYLVEIGSLTYSRCKIWNNSETLWTNCIDNYPKVSNTYRMRGDHYYKNELYDKALTDYNRSIEISANHAKSYVNRGNIYFKIGNNDLALKDYNKAISLDPDIHQSYIHRGILHFNLGDYEAAILDYNTALKIDPLNMDAILNRGAAFINWRKYKEAVNDFTLLLKSYPDNDQAYYNRGMAYYYLTNFDDAIVDYNRALKINLTNASAYLNRSVAYKAKGQKGLALKDALKARSLGYNVNENYINELRN